MRVMTVVGARPQFVKAAVVSRVLRNNHQEIFVHTGQHYDYNMSQQFFDELNIPSPDYNLGVSGGTHAQMTGKMLISLEEIMEKERPDWVLVYGDTNSTLAAALAAVKLHIPICHAEAGCRTHNRYNPEEINRVLTDHAATLLLGSTQSSMEELKHEGLAKNSYFVGDPMFDAFLLYGGISKIQGIKLHLFTNAEKEISLPEQYYYLTCHREENTQNDMALIGILTAMNGLKLPVIYPVHPRNKERMQRLCQEREFKNIYPTEPVGYLDNIALIKNATAVVTDSGGVQREAFFAGVKCVTVLDYVVWPETMIDNRNILSAPIEREIIEKLSMPQTVRSGNTPFGDGHAAEKIVACLENFSFEEGNLWSKI